MKIQFVRNILVDVQKPRLEEVWDKQYRRWDELIVETISYNGKKANIYTSDGDILIDVPDDSFVKV